MSDGVIVKSEADGPCHTCPLSELADAVRQHINAPDDDHRDALLLPALIRFFQHWEAHNTVVPTGAVQHPNRES